MKKTALLLALLGAFSLSVFAQEASRPAPKSNDAAMNEPATHAKKHARKHHKKHHKQAAHTSPADAAPAK